MDTKEAVATPSEPQSAVVANALSDAQRTECVIHLRFFPDGTVAEIGERPSGVEPHDWYKYLCNNTQNSYQALSGGRGLFRLLRTEVDALKASCAAGMTS
ncbi:RNA polymerase sigma factor sigma-70 region 4 domain-containing protein [Methylocaldum gracile]|jgi:hypothetical protein|uniref:hypothetical protein n=1 Tax=unclassified Methylocaldum TaxID=2622260 RepID=UPI0010DA4C4F